MIPDTISKGGTMDQILWIGDLHCQYKNLDQYPLFISKIKDICSQYTVSKIVLAGDLLHGHSVIRTEPLNAILEIVHEFRQLAQLTILVGNHDYINASQFCTTEHPFNAFKSFSNVIVVDHPQFIDDCVYMPYVPVGRMVEALDTFTRHEWRNARVVFGHQEILGVREGGFVSTNGDKWSTDFPTLISGHIHTRQKLKNVYYPGTPMQYTFGDTENKTVSLFGFTTENRLASIDISLGLRTYQTYNVSIEAAKGFRVPDNTCVRLQVCGTISEIMGFKKSKQYKALVSQGVKIIPMPDETIVTESPPERITYLDLLRRKVESDTDGVRTVFHQLFDSIGDRL